MPVLCRDYSLLFIMTPITACSAIGRALQDELGGEFLPHVPLRDARGRVVVDSKHGTLGQLTKHDLLTEDQASQLFKFATVRNPFDRLVSIYAKRKNKLVKHLDKPDSWIHRFPAIVEDIQFVADHTFEQWVAARHSRGIKDRLLRQGRSKMMMKWLKGVDFVIRYERLDDDFQEALRRAGVTKSVAIPRFHVTAGRSRDYREWYTPKARRIAEDYFADILDAYDYSF